jgi:hypothetical protein
VYDEFAPQARMMVLEFWKSPATKAVHLVLSLPKRDGTVTRVWRPLAGGLLTSGQLEDIEACVVSTVRDWLLPDGIQRELG